MPIVQSRLTGLLATGVMLAQQPGSISGSASEHAPEQAAPQSNSGGIGDHRGGNLGKKLDKRLAHMSKRYKLTADQRSQIKSILRDEQQDAQLVNSDTFMLSGDRRDEITDMHQTNQQKIAAILTDQQRHKFDADEKRRAWMDGRLPEPNPGPALNGGW
jgi:Spy/CpxP family protein refolding chaperone